MRRSRHTSCRKHLLRLISLSILCFSAVAESPDESLFGVFSDLGAPNALSSGTLARISGDDSWEISTNFYPMANWDETVVFNTELQSHDSGLNWALRIGKGGQLYSIVFPGLGELVPPQYLAESAWNDEVFQATCVNSPMLDNKSDSEMGGYGDANTHGSGMYFKPELDPTIEKPFYCPMLASFFDASNRSYSVVNIGLIPNPTVKQSYPLFYTQFRDIGEGVVEMTYCFYNFGDYMYNLGSTPWGGLRMSVLPDQLRGLADGSYEDWDAEFGGSESVYQVASSGGWFARAQDRTDLTSLAVGLVHGLDQHYAEQMALAEGDPARFQSSASVFVAGDTTAHGARDFGVLSFSNRYYLDPGKAYFRRVYLVMGTLADVQSNCESLATKTDYGYIDTDPAHAQPLPLYKTEFDGQTVLTHTAPSNGAISVASSYATPVDESLPLILMREVESGKYFISTDHYASCSRLAFENQYAETNELYEAYQDAVVYRLYDRRTEWVGLLGFVLPVNEAELSNESQRLSTVLGDDVLFVPGDKLSADELMIWTGSPEVVSANEHPVFSADVFTGATQTFVEFSGSLSATDTDGETLTYEAVFGPAWLSVSEDGSFQGTASESDVGLGTWTVRVSDGNGGVDTALLYVNVSRAASNALVGYWAFDDGAGDAVTDWSLNGLDGTASNGVWTNGVTGGAMDFNLNGATVTLQPESFASISNEITFALWIYGDESQPMNHSVLYAEDALGDRVLNIHLPYSNGQVFWDAGSGTTYDRLVETIDDASLYKGQWNHWVFTKNVATGSMKVYVNGSMWSEATSRTQVMGGIVAASIGSKLAANHYAGLIDDVRLYNVELSAEEITNLYSDSQLVHIPELVSSGSISDGSYHVKFVGTPGQHYRFEMSDDLLTADNWLVVEDIISLEASPSEMSVPMTNSAGYYRVIWLP